MSSDNQIQQEQKQEQFYIFYWEYWHNWNCKCNHVIESDIESARKKLFEYHDCEINETTGFPGKYVDIANQRIFSIDENVAYILNHEPDSITPFEKGVVIMTSCSG